MSCCQNDSGCRIKRGDIDSICIDCWRWDKGQRYHIVLDKQKGYISRCSIDGETDSVTIPVELNSYDVDEIKENVDKLKGKVILDCHNIIKLPGVYHI